MSAPQPPEAAVEAAAQDVADHFHPPQTYERYKDDWRKWPEGQQTEMYTDRRGPDDTATVVFKAGDGHNSWRALTFREVLTAALPHLHRDWLERLIGKAEAEVLHLEPYAGYPNTYGAFQRSARQHIIDWLRAELAEGGDGE